MIISNQKQFDYLIDLLKMDNKSIQIAAWIFAILGCIILVYFTISTSHDGYSIISDNKIDFPATGQFGDFVGGVIGTIFSVTGTLLIYMSFQEQTKQNRKESFESSFFEIIRLHRENVNELRYTKFENDPLIEDGKGSMSTSYNRKVFRLIFIEFKECYREIREYSQFFNQEDIIDPKYIIYLNKIKKINNLELDLKETALIDIAYSIVYYGMNSGGIGVLEHSFLNKYKIHFIDRLLYFIGLKPMKRYLELNEQWDKFRIVRNEEIISQIDYMYINRNNLEDGNVLLNLKYNVKLLIHNKYAKYYVGHQDRLGHYFRNLFQAYKYLDNSEYLETKEKYFYGKTLRAQLSTYEQLLLFVNSISSLGMKWELAPVAKIVSKGTIPIYEKNNFITCYNLIKNLPSTQVESILYKTYYPNVKYENEEQFLGE